MVLRATPSESCQANVMLHFLWTGRKDSSEAPYSTLGWVNGLVLADVCGND